MFRVIALVAALSSCGLAAAHAQGGDPMESYRLYRDALQGGDDAAALSHAKDAYDRAEAAWGAGNSKTALLATNYGVELLAAGRPAEAAPIFERCTEVLASMADKATDRAFCFLKAGDAYGRTGESGTPKARKAYEQATDVASPFVETDLRAAGVAGEAYLGLATKAIPSVAQMRTSWEKNTKDSVFKRTKDVAFNPYTPVKRYADKALPLLEKAYGPSNELVAMALLYQGFYEEADEEWIAAEKLYSRSYDILRARYGEEHNLTRQVFGRQRIAYAKTVKGQREYNADDDENWGTNCWTETRGDRVFNLCPATERKKPRYPTSGSYAGQHGFATVRYDVDESGATGNIRIIESWPGETFDNASIEAVKRWKFKPPTDQNGAIGAVQDVEFSITFFIIGN